MKKDFKKRIRITCKGAASLVPEKFEHFQGRLKSLSKEDYEKLKKSILEHGFSFPIFIWRNKKRHKIIDGHQRLVVVLGMVKEGYWIEGGKLPVDWIEARNEKEAKAKILLAMSQYGKTTEKSFMKYVESSGLDLKELNLTIDIPTIDIDKFLKKNGKKDGQGLEIEFAQELLEEHNYIVLYFDNAIDWLQAQTVFGLKRYKALHAKPGFNVVGVGRVIKGVEVMERIRGPE